MIGKKYLFSPGPVMTSERVKSSLVHPDMCHRRPGFEQIYHRVRINLLRLYNADDSYVAVVISGSGTAANETVISSIFKETEEFLLIKNGEFGERLDEILTCYGFRLHVLDYSWGSAIQIKDIEQSLAKNKNIQWVCLVYHETSTGVCNPIQKVGEVTHKYQRKLFVDCVSAVGGEDINLVRDHIDICSGVPNKAVSGLPGVSFVAAKRNCIPKINEVPRRNIYLNLQKHIEVADHLGQTPNTPSVTMIVALDEALQELLDEGLENRISRYKACSKIIRDGIKKMNLKMLIPEKLSSNTVTSVFLPQGIRLNTFIDEMDRRGYVVYPGKRHLYDQNMFQIAVMGQIQPEDCIEFLMVMEDTLTFLKNSAKR